ncbi:guanitoxin biosynthesis heme-dependent pre-guanitoxin N-hydroxylase GntA [Micromonospora sp. NPDC005806]|uniref:guanitoxin biosynthesis heme-dependent pre-guanitoxin N-hydroxylase GntA n=1 Tax=Micromonospora sp. NPDC005806 TaxID=3364234 RepID=UPI0036B4CFEC
MTRPELMVEPAAGWVAAEIPPTDAVPVAHGVFTVQGRRLCRISDGRPAHARTRLLHDKFRAAVLSSAYPCVMGASAMRADNYAFAVYEELGAEESARCLATDLEWFVQSYAARRTPQEPFATFISMYERPMVDDEADFERLLWRHLSFVHEWDRRRWPWDPAVSMDPDDPRFSFSVSGQAFFVVGMHPKASRIARTAPALTLVFNLHAQFDALRQQGQMDRVSRTIRAKDGRLQGRPNPMLTQFGEAPEARQYAGREVEADWQCPFAAPATSTAGAAFPNGAD